MKKIIFLLCLLLLAGCSDTKKEVEGEEGRAEIVAANLNIPWDINKHGNTFFISERIGRIAVVEEEQLTFEEVRLSDELSSAPEAGLLGFVLKPDFAQTQEAFAYYTYDRDGSSYNRIVTIKREQGSWIEQKIHLDNVQTGSIHHGGRLEISPDGTLFATIGDAGNPDLAQDSDSLNGKILSLTDEGSFEIYSSGHRNPQGLAWDTEGTLYESEHGQSANDEINRIEEGSNYGYPIIEGEETKEGLITPIYTTGKEETWAPSGVAFHKGKLYIATLRGQAIKVLNLETRKVEQSISGYGRIRDVFSDGDSIYFISNNTDGRGNPGEEDDKLYRLKEKN